MTEHTTTRISVRGCGIGLMRGGTGRPLLILHGASGAGNWLPYMADLAARHDVIVPEHPGFGASDTPDWLDTSADLASFYLDFLDQLDLSDVDLVGFSLGGWIAAELAVRNTSRLASLTLVAAAGIHVTGVEQIDPFLRTDEQRIRDFFHDPKRADDMVQRLLRPEFEDANLKNRTTTARLVWQPRGYNPHLHKWLHRIDVPTLLVWGANDRMFPPEYAHAYQRLIPGSKVVIIPDCGHVPQIEQRQALCRRAGRLSRRPEGRRMKIFNFHLMPYRHADLDAIESNGSAWVTFSNRHYDPEKGAGLYHEYLDQMELADRLGFDGVCLNEHHQTAYGMMPIPGVLAGALARSVKRAKLAILGRALPLVNNPLMIAEEYAMLDNLTRGRFIAGFVRGIGAEYHAMGINPAQSQERFAEAHDLIVRAWTEPGPFQYVGKHYHFNYVNTVAAALPDAASADLDSVAGLQQHHQVGGADALHLRPDAVADRGGGAHVPDVPRRGGEGRLPGHARPARLVEHHLRRRHRREGDARGAAASRGAGQPLPEDADRDAAAAGLQQHRIDQAHPRRQGDRQAARPRRSGQGGVVIVGSPNTVREKLAEYQDLAGFNTSLTKTQFGTLPDDMTRANMAAIAEEVLPHFRDRVPQRSQQAAAE